MWSYGWAIFEEGWASGQLRAGLLGKMERAGFGEGDAWESGRMACNANGGRLGLA